MKAASSKIWMPLYIGDYLADTMSLSKAEHGSYLLALMAYWRKQGPLSDAELKAVAGREFERVSRFFSYTDNHWHHKRVQEEIERAVARTESAREKAMAGVRARLGRT